MIAVTGGASGIGAATAQALLGQGYDVAVIDLDSPDATPPPHARAYHADVTNFDSLVEVFVDIDASTTEGLTGLVNCAGLTRTGPTSEFPLDDWVRVIAVDLTGTFYTCRAAVAHLRPGAAIVNLASIASVRALPGRAAYTAAKFGVVGLTRVLAVEWAARGIRVNAVGPGWTKTPLLDDLIQRGRLAEDELVAKIPIGRLAAVDDVVSAICFLLSDQSGFITGQTLYVDGGYLWSG